jgi:hypothetical protein
VTRELERHFTFFHLADLFGAMRFELGNADLASRHAEKVK